jgi:hypothetical protein
MLTLIAAGCSTVATEPLCSRTEAPRTAHAAALANDGGPQSVSTGRTLIAMIDAGCAQ